MAARKKAKRGRRPSMRKAINDFCRYCIHDPKEPGSWRAQVERCPSSTCPLYPLRPRSTAAARG